MACLALFRHSFPDKRLVATSGKNVLHTRSQLGVEQSDGALSRALTAPAPLLSNLRLPGAAEGIAPASAAGFSRSPRGGAVGRHRLDSGRGPLTVTWSWRWRDLGYYPWPVDLSFWPEFLGLARCFPKENSSAPRSGRVAAA